MKRKIWCILLAFMMMVATAPCNLIAVYASDNIVYLEDEEISDEEAFEFYSQEDVEMEDDVDDGEEEAYEGEEESMDDEVIDVEGEGAELGAPIDDEFEEWEDSDVELQTENDPSMDAELPEDDGESVEGYEEIINEEVTPEDSDNEDNVGEEGKETGDEASEDPTIDGNSGDLGASNSIDVASSITVGYQQTNELKVTFKHSWEKLYYSVKDKSVCSVTKVAGSGKKATLNVTGNKSGKSTYITIKAKVFGFLTLHKEQVRVNVPSIQTSPASELNVVKAGRKGIKVSFSNAPGLKIHPTYSKGAGNYINAKWSKWNGKSITLYVTGKKTGSAEVFFEYYEPKTKKYYGSKRIRINVRGTPNVTVGKKTVNLVVGESVNVNVGTNGLYGENAKLTPKTTNSKAYSATWSKKSKASGVIKITGKKKGKGTINFYLKSKSTGNQLAKASISITVSKPSLAVEKDVVNVETGKTVTIKCTAKGMKCKYGFACDKNTTTKLLASVGGRNKNTEQLAIKGQNAGVGKVTVYIKKGSRVFAKKDVKVNVKPASKPTIKINNSLTFAVGNTIQIKPDLNHMPTGKIGLVTQILSGSEVFTCSQPTKNTPSTITLRGKKTGSGSFVIRVYNSKGKQIAQKSVSVRVTTQNKIQSVAYNFCNFGTKPSEAVCRNMFVKEHGKALYKSIKADKDWGNCFGMSTTAGLLYSNNGITPALFKSSAVLPQNLDKSGKGKYGKFTLKEWIQAMMISQFAYDRVCTGNAAYDHHDCTINSLVNQLKADLSKGNNTEIEVFHVGKNTYGHSLLGIGFENVNSKTDRILVYDSNYSSYYYKSTTKYITLKKDKSGHYTGWSYGSEYSNTMGYLGYTSYDGYVKLWQNHGKLKAISNGNVTTDVTETMRTEDEEILEALEKTNFVSINSDNFTILDVDDHVIATIESGELKQSNDDAVHVITDMDGDDGEEPLTFLYLPIGVYQYRINDSDTDKTRLICANLDLSVSVESDGDTITAVADDSTDLAAAIFEPSEGEDYSISLGSSKEGEPEEMAWEGVGNGESISVALDNGDLSVCNTEGADLSVTADNEDETDVYVITASTDNHGEITPEGATPVWNGKDQEYVIEPDAGYKIKDVAIDDESVGAVDHYKFNNVCENHRIDVTFERDNSIEFSMSEASITGISDKVYNGKAFKQSPTVMYGKQLLDIGNDYGVTHKNNVKVGTASIIVTGKGIYSGSKKITYRINPNETALKKLKAGKKKMTVKWKKQPKQTTGYQIRYSLKKNFKSGTKMVTVKKAKTTKKVIKKLKAKKKYYVQIRTYKKVGKKYYYSKWSKVKTVKVK